MWADNNLKSYTLFSQYLKSLEHFQFLPIEEKNILTSATVFFSAYEKKYNRRILIKRFNKSLDKYHEFEVESYALNNIDQNNIIKPIGIFEDDDFGYIVLPYAEGGDLFDIMHSKMILFNNDQLIQIAFCLLSALDKIHSKGFVYRDMKLENIVFLKKFDELSCLSIFDDMLLIDFGSCYIESKSKCINEFRGTDAYRAPEYIFHRRVTDKYDIFSLGILLYYLAVAYLPLDENKDCDEFEMKILLSSNNISNLFAGEEWDGISDGVKQLIQSMLLFDENARPSSRELLNDDIFANLLSPYAFNDEDNIEY